MAAKYLSIPATSVASEKLFSTARHIITDQHNSLDPERAEMLLFLESTFVFITHLQYLYNYISLVFSFLCNDFFHFINTIVAYIILFCC